MPSQLASLLFAIPLAASGLTGVALHVCQSMGGTVVGNCDCADERKPDHGVHSAHAHHTKHAEHEGQAKLGAQPCCTIELYEARAPVATHRGNVPEVDDAPIAITTLHASISTTARWDSEANLFRERAPPNAHGPPLFIRHCSFLN